MRTTLLRITATVAIALVSALSAPSGSWAVSPDPSVDPTVDLAAAARAADAVVVAKVSGMRVRDGRVPGATRPFPETETRVRVTRVLAGARPESVVLTQPGGEVGGIGLHVPGLPEFLTGRTYVLFLAADGSVLGGSAGCLTVADGRVVELGITVNELARLVADHRAGRDPATVLSVPARSSEGPLVLPAGLTGTAAAVEDIAPAAASSTITISSVSPTKQIAGQRRTVEIAGSGFGSAPGRVQFVNGLSTRMSYGPTAPVVSWSDTQVVVEVPPSASSGPLVLTTAAGVQAKREYDVSFSASPRALPAGKRTFRIRANTADIADEATQAGAALQTWNEAGSRFRFVNGGASSKKTGSVGRYDGENTISFSTTMPVGGTLAMNYLWYYPGSPEYLESDIILNDTYLWGSTSSSTRWDVRTVVLHELGHSVGLDDQYPNTWRVMGAAVKGQNKRTLSPDEKAGAMFLHGADAPTVPVVSSPTHPSQSAWYRAETARVQFVSQGDVAGYSFLVDGAPATVPDAVIDTTGTVADVALAEGERWFHVRAVDSFGVGGPTAHFRLRTDLTAPVGSVSFGVGGSVYTSSTALPVTAALTDALSGVVSARFDTGGGWSAWQSFSPAMAATLPATDGTHTVRAEYRDGAGNIATFSSQAVLDRVAPVTAADAPSRAHDQATVSLAASDDRSGVAMTRFRVGDGPWRSYAGPFTIARVGEHRIALRSVDRAGNEGAAAEFTVTVEPSFPAADAPVIGRAPWYSALCAGTIRLGWAPATPVRAPVVTYQVVFADGVLATQSAEPAVSLAGLVPGSSQGFGVRAIAADGACSAESPQLAVRMPTASGTVVVGSAATSATVAVPPYGAEKAGTAVCALGSASSGGELRLSRTSTPPRALPRDLQAVGGVWSPLLTGSTRPLAFELPLDPRLPGWRAERVRALAFVEGDWVAAVSTVRPGPVSGGSVRVEVPSAVPFVLVEPAGTDRAVRASAGPGEMLSPAYGRPALVAVRLTDAAGAPVTGRAVVLESAGGARVATLSEVAGAPGVYRGAAPVVRSRAAFRVRFAGDDLNSGVSRGATVLPQAYLSRAVPSSAHPGQRFRVSGVIRPAHTNAPVRVEVQRRGADGRYRPSAYSKTVRTSTTAVRTTLALPRGTWRVRLLHEDGSHARTVTAWARVLVR